MASRTDAETATEEEQQLSQLVSALASGARAVQHLPLDDDFSFGRSFPEFSSALAGANTSLVEALQAILKECSKDEEEELSLTSAKTATLSAVDPDALLEDPLWWEDCADVCDALVEQVEATLSSDTIVENLTDWSSQARQKSASAFGRMVEGTVDMEKPQQVFQIPVDNGRDTVFVPAVHPDKPFSVVPLDLTLQPGHGLTKKDWQIPRDIVAPTHHVPHIYQSEIEALEYREWQLQQTEKPPPITAESEPLQATFIDTVEELQALAAKLEQVQEVAIDLEAHSYRSFAGLVCLMQITIRTPEKQNFLIDTLKLHSDINAALAPFMANPDIVKVMHGADSDIQWLQRDFGCYIVNLFDTGRASRALQYPSAGYAYLLQHYANVAADKTHQMADWRQRPLTDALLQYAIADTHYLLDIYDHLKWDLQQHDTASIKSVLDDSKKISLIRYSPEPFLPSGYEKLLRGRRGRKTRTELNEQQTAVLKALWDWRDATARAHDESAMYVCTNSALTRLALSMPTTTTALQSLFNPLPPLLLEHSLLQCIQHAISRGAIDENDGQDGGEDVDDDDVEEEVARQQSVGTRSSAFFKPANTEKESMRDGIMSPVLGTEALYKEAGWMTPSEQMSDLIVSSTDDDLTTAGEKPKRLLSISNADYQSTKEGERGRSADGTGTLRAIRSISPGDIEEAKKTAASVERTQKRSVPVVLGMISHEEDLEEHAETRTSSAPGTTKEGTTDTDDLMAEEEFVIPRSMREIYKISNRNRRNKKAGSPTPERGVTPTNEKEREELVKAEALIRERAAAGYLDLTVGESPGKRPRIKSRTGRESEESVPQDSHNAMTSEDDLAFMQEIGWVKDKNEIMKGLHGKGKPSEDASPADGTEGNTSPGKQSGYTGFDYSNSVGVVPAAQPANPFFSGDALKGGPLAQGFSKPTRSKTNQSFSGGKAKQSRGRQERPEKKDGRSHAYRKR